MRTTVIIALCCLLTACEKDEGNPFDDLVYPDLNPPTEALPTDNFAWLHQRIFRPTCAQSGCHDGNFEPEFRTISSTYNSLVYHPCLSNDAQNTYTYRVLPGDASHSLLYARLTMSLPNTSGQMPLELQPGSDWPQNEDVYIQKIHDWIEGGAKDMFGHSATLGNLEPQVIGLLAFPAGTTTTPFPRGSDPGVQPIEIPPAPIDLWFAFDDDSTAANALQYNQFKYSTDQFGMDGVAEQPLQITGPITGPDFGNVSTSFTHRGTVDLTTYAPGSVVFLRVYINDGDHTDNSEIPSDGTGEPMLSYFTLLVVP